MFPWHNTLPGAITTATLLSPERRRLGRLATRQWVYRWEWLDGSWPDQPFRIVPKRFEAPPDPETSFTYGSPRWMTSVNTLLWLHTARDARVRYKVAPLDAPQVWLGLLLVGDRTLHWLGMEQTPSNMLGQGFELRPTAIEGTFPAVRSWHVQALDAAPT